MFKKISYNKTGNLLLFYLWAATAYFFALLAMLLLIKVFFSGKEITDKAIENGQIITVAVENGKVEGNLHSSQKKSQVNSSYIQTEDQKFNQIISKEGLNPAPNPELVEQIDKLSIPKVGKEGSLPWKYYARPYNAKEKHPQIAIVFTNLGLNKTLTQEVVKLSHDMTLGFSPYASDSGKWATQARQTGFESVIDLPVQTDNYPVFDPGPLGLMEDLSAEDNINRLYTTLSQFPSPVGVLASIGEKMTANNETIKPYLAELKKRGLLFIYVKTAKNKEMEELSKSFAFYTIGVDLIIDDEISRASIETSLESLMDIAKAKGYAVGLAHSYPPTLETLANWSANLKSHGIDLVPVSAIGKILYP